jgi:hypothetical protein
MSNIFGDLTGGYLAYEGLEKAKDVAKALPQDMLDAVGTIGGMTQPYTEFKPFTVTTGTGTASASRDPNTGALGVSFTPEQQDLINQLQQQASSTAGMMGQTTPEQLMAQMQQLRAPEQARQNQALENRLAAQGRLGVQTSAYGGTPEQLALAQAQQQQLSQDALSSITGARSLQNQDIQNVTGLLGAAALPQQQMIQAFAPALQTQNLASNLGLQQASTLGQLGAQYISQIPTASSLQGELSQAQANTIINALLGQQNAQSGAYEGLLGQVGDWIGGLFGDSNPQTATTGVTGSGQGSGYTDANGNWVGI